jgi:hypothetical protein
MQALGHNFRDEFSLLTFGMVTESAGKRFIVIGRKNEGTGAGSHVLSFVRRENERLSCHSAAIT